MARVIKLLQYQLIDYWRRAFSLRGKYDRSAGFLLLIIPAFAYKYIVVLNGAAKSPANGGTENLNLLLTVVFLAWILPVLESQVISAKIGNFLHLPLTKNQFAVINFAAVFLLPTSVIPAVVSLTAIYPLVFAKNVLAGVISFFIFVLLSACTAIAFFYLLKQKIFRIAVFTAAIIFAFLFVNHKLDFIPAGKSFPAGITNQNPESSFGNIFFLSGSLLTVFLPAFFSIRLTISEAAQTNGKLFPARPARIKFPVKFGELLKKDFICSWKILDCWVSLLASVFYAILLVAGNFSFQSFSIAIAVIGMLSGSLAFNSFGLENNAGIERLSIFPIKPEELIKTKNKAFAFVIGSQTFFLFPIIFFKFGAVFFIISILKTISIMLLYTAWGNYLSIRFPFKMYFYQLAVGGSLTAMLYRILVISLPIIVPEFIAPEDLKVKLIYNSLLIGLSLFLYKFSLQQSAKKLPENWENIALKLS